jgi:hypothetical protein
MPPTIIMTDTRVGVQLDGSIPSMPVEYAKIMSASRDIGPLVSTADKAEEGCYAL